MARIRKFVCYRSHKRPYTRFSKYKKHSYIRARPANRIARYTSGKQKDEFVFDISLTPNAKIQIRDHAIESARLSINRAMEKVLGKTGYFLQVRIFPHHILRENPLASGAGADRLSTGMAHSYGKPIGRAAQVRVGQELFTVKTTKEHVALARKAMKRAAFKLPCSCRVVVRDNSAPKLPAKSATKAPAKVPKKEVKAPAAEA